MTAQLASPSIQNLADAKADEINMFGIKRFRTKKFDNDDEDVDVDCPVMDSPAMDKLSKFILDSLKELEQ